MTELFPVPGHLRALQATSILLGSTIAGATASISVFLTPRLVDPEVPRAMMLRQGARALVSARRILALPMVVPGLLDAYLAYRLGGRRVLYVAAAALTLSTLPHAVWVMNPVNFKLMGVLEDVEGEATLEDKESQMDRSETARALVAQWGVRNLYRSGVTLLAGALGLYAALA